MCNAHRAGAIAGSPENGKAAPYLRTLPSNEPTVLKRLPHPEYYDFYPLIDIESMLFFLILQFGKISFAQCPRLGRTTRLS